MIDDGGVLGAAEDEVTAAHTFVAVDVAYTCNRNAATFVRPTVDDKSVSAGLMSNRAPG